MRLPAGTRIVLDPTPPAHFGAGVVDAVAGAVRGTGGQAAVIVTDQGLAGTPVVASVVGALAAGGIPVTVFSGVHANPTAGDVAAGAEAVAPLAADGGRPALVAVGGGSSVDAAKGIAVAAVNPERGAGDTARGTAWNADAAIDAVAALVDTIGMTHRLPDFGITAADFDGIAADALDDEVLANTPRPPARADIRAILTGALDGRGQVPPTRAAGPGPGGG